ncbi:MAG: NAD-dependent epimerase/dehydratase family protein [Bacteroidota bacterium]
MIPHSNILITGSTGFLGSRLLERILESDFSAKIIGAGRSIKPHASFEDERLTYVLGDLSDSNYVERLFNEFPIDCVVNCAALSSPWGKYDEFYQANVQSQHELIKQAEAKSIRRYVHISTPSLYFDFQDKMNVKESDPLPINMPNYYAATKLEADRLLQTSNLSWISLRPRALVGRGDTVIMPRVIRAADEGRLRIIGDGNNHVDLTPVANVVDAIILSINAQESAAGEIYNIANGAPVSLWPILQATLAKLGRELPQKKIPLGLVMNIARLMEFYSRNLGGYKEPSLTAYGVGTIAYSFSLDIAKAKEKLGYSPRLSVEEAIDEFVDWYKAQQDES